jgi:hypothetical protein
MEVKQLRRALVAVPIAVLMIAAPAAAEAAKRPLKPVGWGPLSSKRAAKLIKRSGYEPRPENRAANHRVPKRALLRAWRRRSEMPYARFVDGRFRGTTDEILQWAARKWGLPVRVLRAVAVVESWWQMSAVGDNGDSFGIFQVRRPYHCWGECRIARRFTAFNADYYGGIIRAYFDGTQGWLNTVERGRQYESGDLWGSIGAWFSGRWWTEPAAGYIEVVRQRLRERTWRRDYFRHG